MGKMIIKGKLINQFNDKVTAKSQDGKSVKEVLLEMDSSNLSNSELHQCVSVLDMEQSYSKIDKIDEETEDDGTYNTNTHGNSEREHASLMRSRVTLNNEDSKLMTGTSNSISNIEVSVE